ncbi:MAG TPA: lipid II flippase MurJ [Thermotogota bacterium]|nr:lipid II flippase MurJ [Thermotogota bacterium]
MRKNPFHNLKKLSGGAQSIAVGTLALSFFTLISKFLGFLREIVVAAKFGTSWRMDAVIIAMEPAETVAGIVAGTIGTMMIPFYLELKREGDTEKLRTYASQVLKLSALVMLLFGVILFVFPNTMIHLFAPSFSGEVLEYAARKLKIFSILPVIHGFGAIFTAILRSERKFIQMASSQLILNVVAIPVVFVLAPVLGETAFVVAWVGGYGVMHLVLGLVCLPRLEKKQFFSLQPLSTQSKKTLSHAIPLIAGRSSGLINPIIDKVFASFLPAGRVAALRYSHVLLTMINGLLISSFLTTTFTEIGETVAEKNFSKLENRLKKTANDMINLVIPITFWVILMAEPLISFLFQRGSFDQQSTSLVSASLIGYSIIILTAPIGGLVGNVLVSMKDLRFINTLAVASIGANAFFDWILMAPFGHAGIAGSSAVVGLIHTTIGYFWLKKKYKLPFLQWKPFLGKLAVGGSLFSVLFLLRTFLGDGLLWMGMANGLFFLFFLFLNKKMIRALSSKLSQFRGRK